MRLFSLVLGLLMVSGVAVAQEPEARSFGSPHVTRVPEIEIHGRYQRPRAFYIVNRATVGRDERDLRTSFVRDVVTSVDRDAF